MNPSITYRVKMQNRKRCETVVADYFRVDAGVLTFRKINPSQGYPIFVKCYAAGTWVTVENVDVPTRATSACPYTVGDPPCNCAATGRECIRYSKR